MYIWSYVKHQRDSETCKISCSHFSVRGSLSLTVSFPIHPVSFLTLSLFPQFLRLLRSSHALGLLIWSSQNVLAATHRHRDIYTDAHESLLVAKIYCPRKIRPVVNNILSLVAVYLGWSLVCLLIHRSKSTQQRDRDRSNEKLFLRLDYFSKVIPRETNE